MSRIPNLVTASLVLVAFVALGVLVVLVFGSQTGGPPATPIAKVTPTPVAQTTSTPPPYPPPGSPTPPGPPATPGLTPTPLPPCAFAAAPAPTTVEPSLDAYVLSEPRVMLTHTAAIGISGWLPDSERLLIVRDIPSTNRQTIETFNVHTGEMHLYAESGGGGFWLPQHQAVAYFDWVWIDQAKGKARRDLWISPGDPKQVQRVVEGVSWNSNSAAVDPGGYLFLFPEATGERPQVLDAASRFFQVLSFPLDPTRWQYAKYPESAPFSPYPFQIIRRPGSSQLALYTPLWTFLFDMKTNQGCEIDLGGNAATQPVWALQAQWSPDGRYLALITTNSQPRARINSTGLAILNMETGQLRTLQPARVVTDIAWAPNGHHLAALGIVRVEDIEREEIFIIDAATGEFQRGLPEQYFGGGSWGEQLAWSPDGSQLAVNCPTTEEGRLCIITLKPRGAQEK